MGLPPIVVFQQINSGMNAFAMMAIPFFIYAGDLMVRGGIADRLIRFAAGLVGHLRGGLGQVNIVASTLFGGISGSAVADASAVGGIMIPQMEKRGYAKDYAVNVTVNAAIIALLVPPSHNMIIYSIAAGGTVSVADLFTAGIVPGLLLAVALMITAYVVAVRRGYPSEPFPGFAHGLALVRRRLARHPADRHHLRRRPLRRLHRDGKLLHRGHLRAAGHDLRLPRDDLDGFHRGRRCGAVRTTAMVLLVIGCASAFGWLMAFLQVPQATIAAMQALSDNPIVILLLINVILLVLGTFMDMAPMIIICTPIFLPVVKAFGVDPRAFRRRPDPQRRHRAQHAAGRLGAVRRLRGRQDQHRRGHEDDLAVLRRQRRGAAARHLCSGLLPLAAGPVQVATVIQRAQEMT